MRQLCYALLWLLWVSACSSGNDHDEPTPEIRPNILLIIADDMGVEATPGYEAGTIKPNMPTLSSLAATGITFDNVWANPVCAPTRATMLTGKYGYHTGVVNVEGSGRLPDSELVIQKYIDQNTNNAYSHAVIGKWHLSGNDADAPTNFGIDYFAGSLGGGVNGYDSWSFTENGQTSNSTEYVTTKYTDLAIDWIAQQDQPWFCWMAYNAAHTPFHLPPEHMHSQGALPSDEESIDANPLPYFMAMIESMDFEMGRLIDNIPTEQLQNTIIIFIGDNGSHPRVIQDPFDADHSKGSLYQGGIHVPMIISGQGVSRINDRDNNLINSADLFATIAELAGLDLANYQDSHSFLPLLTTVHQGDRDYNYAEFLDEDRPNQSGYTIRDFQYKLIQFDSGQERFYDLVADPYETNNLLRQGLSNIQQNAYDDLLVEAGRIRS